MGRTRQSVQNRPVELAYTSSKTYEDPFEAVTVDVVVSGPAGQQRRVPAFWAGEQEWRVRFAPQETGTYEYRTECSDVDNPDLHEREGELHVDPYEGENPLFEHGPIQIAGEGHFEHADGTPFFWLGDTWWMAVCDRLEWPAEFKELTADRRQKNYTVIHMVAGLFPDMEAFDERGANAAGFPWEQDFERINPAYFDEVDLKIQWLVREGLVPCIFGSWGYYLPWTGVETMKRHWRHLIARYGAYPVIWSIAGETQMPYYLSDEPEEDADFQREGWAEVAEYLREIDPYDRPMTTHPGGGRSGRDRITDESVLDFDMIQTSHGGHDALVEVTEQMREAVTRTPEMPVVSGEGFYEGILEGSREEVQRYAFWGSLLSGHVGYTYAANGIWQLNREGDPYGPSPHGNSWGNRPWSEAAQLPGGRQIGVGKRLLEQYDWWRFEPHPEWIEIEGEDDPRGPFAAGIPGEVRVCYFPAPNMGPSLPQVLSDSAVAITDLETGADYEARLVDPKDASESDLGAVDPTDGTWEVPGPEIMQDWVLVLE